MKGVIQNKYPSLCAHDFQKSLTNLIQLPCNQDREITHRITQFGKFCSKCTQIINNSYDGESPCIVCQDTIEQYIQQRELCQHDMREFDDIHIKCMNEPNLNHEIPFRTPICRKCCDKVSSAFLNSKQCKICAGLQSETIKDLQKIYISPSYSHIKNIITLLQSANAPEDLYRNEIESACKAGPQVVRVPNGMISQKMVDSYNSEDRTDAHLSKRYKLYPKCRKHKNDFIYVCNGCLVSLLNLNCCPFGCVSAQIKQQKKGANQTKVNETGFLNLYPNINKNAYFLQLFVVKLIQERGRLDRWEVSLKKILPKSKVQENYIDNFSLYGDAVAITGKQFLVAGGAVGKTFHQLKPTDNAFIITVSNDNKQFQIKEVRHMNQARTGHKLVYMQSINGVFVVGGFKKEGGFMKETSFYSVAQNKWEDLGQLNIERSKPTLCIFQSQVYVFGGLSSNQNIWGNLCERLNFQSKQWQIINFGGYYNPFLTNSSSITNLIPFQKKETCLLLGGTDYSLQTNMIQEMTFKDKSFNINSMNYKSLESARSGSVLGLISQDTLICFGGNSQYQSFLSIDALKLTFQQQQLKVCFTYDKIQLGSYRSFNREDSSIVYTRIKNQLVSIGVISEDERQLQQGQSVVNPYNCQLLQRLWYSMGKAWVWVAL